MIQPNQICGISFTFYDASTKEGPDFHINGIEITYKEGFKTITETILFYHFPEVERNLSDLPGLIADIINLHNAQK